MIDAPAQHIAVVGMACRFPGAPSVEAFWRNVRNGVDCITRHVPSTADDGHAFRNANFVASMGRLADVDMFDADLFQMSPRESTGLDPQHRVFLECAWEALEHAGYDPRRIGGKAAVFAGCGVNDYADRVRASADWRDIDEFSVRLGNSADFLATRVSHKLNLTGPSLTVQTACSTSLVAVCIGCQSLFDHQSDMVLAGAVSISDLDAAGYCAVDGGILSPDGRCRAFDAEAAGTVPAAGVGIVVLKRLADAIDDRDTIHAVIKGWALNNDGAVKGGYTAPSERQQAEVIAEALAFAGVEPASVGMVEAHGTGTRLGDAIEVAALKSVFCAATQRRAFCALGSVKTNIGHADTAAGVAGLLKAVLSVRDGVLPPSLHFETPNLALGLDASPFYVNTRLRQWPEEASTRTAGVSSFGIGGTNAHVIVGAPPALPGLQAPSDRWRLLTISARNAELREAQCAALASYLQARPEQNLDDIAYTLQMGRSPFPYRKTVVCRSHAEAIDGLRASSRDSTARAPAQSRLAFMFPGQGGHRRGTTADLYRHEPIYRAALDACGSLLRKHVEWDLGAVAGVSGDDNNAIQLAMRTDVAQPALFAVEYALAQLWRSWGLRPSAMIGHSVGEYAAACLAGVFTLDQCLEILAWRGRLMQQMASGGMLAVQLGEVEIRSMLETPLSLAAVNGHNQCVVSGPLEQLEWLEAALADLAVPCRRLKTAFAFHSATADPILNDFESRLRRFELKPPSIPFVSNVSGTWITPEEATDPSYWARHMRVPVRFHDGLRALRAVDDPVLLEVGPGDVLVRLAAQQRAGTPAKAMATLSGPADLPESGRLLHTMGQLWLNGIELDGSREGSHAGRRTPIPTSVFSRKRFWIDKAAPAQAPRSTGRVDYWLGAPSWRQTVPVRPSDPRAQATILVALDDAGVAQPLADRFAGEGHRVMYVTRGSRFARLSSSRYAVNAEAPGDYDRLLASLTASGDAPTHIVHAWSYEDQDGAEEFRAFQNRSFFSVLLMRQALQTRGDAPITLLAPGLCSLDGGIDPRTAPLLAACTVMTQERPGSPVRAIDLGSAVAARVNAKRRATELMTEALGGEDDLVAAYRGADRYVLDLEGLRFDRSPGPPRVRENAVTLIIGGLGSIGLQIAERLSGYPGTRLILMGRTGLPERAQWEGELTRDSTSPASLAILGVLRCEQRGASVVVMTGDVGDERDVQAVVRRADETFGGLDAVVHAAGVLSGPSIAPVIELDPSLCDAQFRAKVYGLYHLERVLAGRNLDFCLILSSLASFLGGPNFLAYAAANAAIDSFVQRHNRLDLTPWTAINLDGWARPIAGEARQAPTSANEIPALTSQQGMAAIDAILRAGALTQVVVASSDPAPRLKRWRAIGSLQQNLSRVASLAKEFGETSEQPAIPSRDPFEAYIVATFAGLLRRECVGVDDNFFAMGGDSLIGLQLMSRIRQRYGLRFDLKTLFNQPTPAGLATELRRAWNGNVADSALQSALRDVAAMSEDDASQALLAQASVRVNAP